MDHAELKKWSKQYDTNDDLTLKEIEETLTTALGKQHYITQEQLKKVMQRKLDAQRGRRDRYIEWMYEVPAAFVQRISEAAFLVDDPKLQLNTLTSPVSVLRPRLSSSRFMIRETTQSVIDTCCSPTR